MAMPLFWMGLAGDIGGCGILADHRGGWSVWQDQGDRMACINVYISDPRRLFHSASEGEWSDSSKILSFVDVNRESNNVCLVDVKM